MHTVGPTPNASRIGPDGHASLGHDAAVTALSVSRDGKYTATGATDLTVIIWSGAAPSKTSLVEVATESIVNSLLFSDTGTFLAGAQGFEVLIWRVADGSRIVSIGGPEWKIACTWTTDGFNHLNLFALGSSAYEAVSLSVTKVHVQLYPPGVDHTGPLAPSSSSEIVVMDASERISGHDLIVQSFSGRIIAAVVCSGAAVCYIWRMVNSAPTYEVDQLTYRRTDPSAEPSCAMFAGDDRFVVGFSDGTISWWDISSLPLVTSEPCGTFNRGSRVISLSASPPASFLGALFNEDATTPVLVRMENFKAQNHISDVCSTAYMFLYGHTRPVKAVCMSPCERYVATASEDTTVRLWSTMDGSHIWTFLDHDAAVTHILFSSDGSTLASADEDGKVCVHWLCRFVRNVPLCSVGGR